MHKAHYGSARGHFQSDTTANRIQQLGLCWPTLYKDCKTFVSKCDRCQRLGRLLPSTEITLISVNPSLTFEIWAIDFIGPFLVPAKRTSARYIITVVEYVIKWAEAEPVDTCSSEVAAKFIYENIITRFGCPITLISDQGSHFINKTITALTEQFKIDHRRSTTYHPQSNGAIEAFNKTLIRGITKICNTDKDDWDEKISTVLWAYRIAYKHSIDQIPF